MKRGTAFSTVNWRRYLDVNENPRAKAFLDARGNDVLDQISSTIHNAAKDGKKELVMVVHPNAGAVIRIPNSEFKELLTLCLKWFEKQENYEKCVDIDWFLSDLEALSKGIPLSRKYRQKVI